MNFLKYEESDLCMRIQYCPFLDELYGPLWYFFSIWLIFLSLNTYIHGLNPIWCLYICMFYWWNILPTYSYMILMLRKVKQKGVFLNSEVAESCHMGMKKKGWLGLQTTFTTILSWAINWEAKPWSLRHPIIFSRRSSKAGFSPSKH